MSVTKLSIPSMNILLSDVTAHCITDLVENQMYYFRVIAENAYGQSDALECEKPVIPKRVFGEFLCRVVSSCFENQPRFCFLFGVLNSLIATDNAVFCSITLTSGL